MRREVSFLALLALNACAGAGDATPPIATCSGDVFSASKVRVASGENPDQPRSITSVSSERSIAAGTRLTAILRNRCDSPGEIAKTIKRDPQAQGLGGVRSYPFFVQQDILLSSLENLARQDLCVVGIADAAVDSVLDLPSDPLVKSQAHLQTLGGSSAYPVFFDSSLGTRRTVVIAVVDTGVDLDHEDLRDVLWVNEKEVPENGIDDDLNGYVDDVNGYNFADKKSSPAIQGAWQGNDHGTHVAGLAAAKGDNAKGGSGVMRAGARVMALNVFGASPGALTYDTENAIRYAADNGADVINLSIGGTSTSMSYRAAIQYAVDRGVTVFAAAGNERKELGSSYQMTPGAWGRSIDGMMTVGSVDSRDNSWSVFSNYSPELVEIAAPGAQDSSRFLGLLSTVPGNGYARRQGTSMSTPVVSGAAALAIQLLRARGYQTTPGRLEILLSSSASAVPSLNDRVRDGHILNLQSLAESIVRDYPALSNPETESPVDPPDRGQGKSPLLPCL